MKTIFLITFLLVGALVIYVNGFNYTALWNFLPALLGFVAFQRALETSHAKTAGCFAFAFSATLMVGHFHLSWLYDWEGTATGSSTAALAFIFVPFWVVFFAAIIALVAWAVCRIFWVKTPDSPK